MSGSGWTTSRRGSSKAPKATTAAAAKGAIVGALLELPISTVENLLLVRGRGKTLQEASVDVLKNVGKSAGAGAAGSMVVTGIALVGVPVGTMAVPLAVVGGTMYTWSAADRIWKARGLARLGREDGLFVREANQERCFGHSGRKDNMTQGISVFLPPVGGCLLVAALCVSTVAYVLTSVVDIVAVLGPIMPL